MAKLLERGREGGAGWGWGAVKRGKGEGTVRRGKGEGTVRGGKGEGTVRRGMQRDCRKGDPVMGMRRPVGE